MASKKAEAGMAVPRHGAVAALAVHGDAHPRRARQHGSGTGGEHAGPPYGLNVQRVRRERRSAGRIEHPLGDHRGGSVVPLFTRLEMRITSWAR
ncbi:hypothetical protein [Nonomuraea sp. NPDC005692]|uniref:hypothetical protein n=1 Tax=Nonomuraea sp. NPDC005692 TaxID=3157168 RepID=UPI0033F5D22F